MEFDTGLLKCRVPKWGDALLASLPVDGRLIARQGRLTCIVQDGADGAAESTPRRERFTGKLNQVTVEQSGPVRAVLKLEGVHKAAAGSREWLPFVVRLYFYAGSDNVRLVHPIIYSGDEQKDFIRGLGVEFAVPLREEVQNRHVRFSGEDGGLWAEPVQPLVGRGGRVVLNPDGSGNVYAAPLAGQRVPNKVPANARRVMSSLATRAADSA